MSKFCWIVVGLVFLSGCESASPKGEKLSGMAQGTTWHVNYWSKETFDSNKLDVKLEVVIAENDKKRCRTIVSIQPSLHSTRERVCLVRLGITLLI